MSFPYKIGEPCPFCLRILTKKVFKDKARHKVIAIKRAQVLAKKEGRKLGPPIQYDRTKIRQLRDEGQSLREIAREIKCSVWAVRLALKEVE